MNQSLKFRLELEHQIIYGVVFDQNYFAFDILRAKNFTKHNILIWNSLLSLWPNSPIDPVTAKAAILNKGGEALLNYFVQNVNISPFQTWPKHCLCLLELDVRAKLISYLEPCYSQLMIDKNPQDAGIVRQLIEFVKDVSMDFFLMTQDLLAYIEEFAPRGIDRFKINDLIDSIPKKAAEIRNRSALKACINNFISYTESPLPTARSPVIRRLTALLEGALTQENFSNELAQEIILLGTNGKTSKHQGISAKEEQTGDYPF